MAKRKAVSIRDVARESQASLTTVSLVLNGRDGRISPATRARVHETASRLGYRPSRLAQGLQAQKSGCLAILVPQIRHAFADAYFGELISAIHDCASEAGYKILLEVANPTFVNKRQHIELFDRHFVDGLLYLGATNNDRFLEPLQGSERAAVIVNNYLPDLKLNHVRCDYHQAGVLAASHLIEQGHRKIALIHGATEVETAWDFRRGFEHVIRQKGIELPKERVADGLYTEEGGAAAAVDLLRRDAAITGIATGNDKMAIGAMSGLKEIGCRVPHDVSIVGCDDIHQAAYCDPPLTTVHTPIYDIGQLACQRLLDLIEGRTLSVEETHPVSLTVRKSVSPPKNAD